MIRRLWAFLLAALLALLSLAAPVQGDTTRTVEAVNHSAFALPHAKDIYLPWQQAQAPPLQLAGINLDGNIRDLQGISIFTNPRAQLNTLLSSLGSTVADYQPGNYTGTLNASAWLNSIGAAPSLAQASGAAQPIILPYSGQKYLANFGVNGNAILTPTKTITGNFVLTADLALDSWTPAANVFLAEKFSGSNGFYATIGTDGKLTLRIYDGVSQTTSISSAAISASAGSRHSVSIEWQDGVMVTFRVDGVQLGNVIANTRVLTNAATTLFVGIGLTGKLYSETITDGVSTRYYGFNASDWPETTTNGATAVSSTTGETWTLNNTGTKLAQIVGSPQLLGDGVASLMQMTATIPPPYFVIAVVNSITWTSTDVLFDGNTSNSFAAQQSAATPQVKMWDGTSLTGAINPTLNTYAIITAGQDAAGNATIQRNNGTPATGTLNATALGGFTLFGNGAGTSFGNAQVKEVILLNAIPSAAKLAQILNLLNQIYHIYAPYASASDWLNELPTVAANYSTYRLAANGR